MDKKEVNDILSDLSPCKGTCLENVEGKRGLILWESPISIGNYSFKTMQIGKCERCTDYAIWCWECGDKFFLKEETDRQCVCGDTWATLIEEDIDDPTGKTLSALHLLLVREDLPLLSLDRRRLC